MRHTGSRNWNTNKARKNKTQNTYFSSADARDASALASSCRLCTCVLLLSTPTQLFAGIKCEGRRVRCLNPPFLGLNILYRWPQIRSKQSLLSSVSLCVFTALTLKPSDTSTLFLWKEEIYSGTDLVAVWVGLSAVRVRTPFCLSCGRTKRKREGSVSRGSRLNEDKSTSLLKTQGFIHSTHTASSVKPL